MFQNKKQIKITILFLIAVIFISQFSIFTLAKTEAYFSLYDNPQKEIIKNINQAEAFINIAMYIFTDREIVLPLVKARERGVKIRLYMDQDQIDYKYSQSRFLVQKGIKTRISTNNYIMHNKFAIIDNRILLTGSYNWTFSANHRNDENLLVIDDLEIIARYQNQFEKIWLNKYSLQRARKLYQIAKVDFPFLSTATPKPGVQSININTASRDELMKILKISELFARKIINLRDSLNEEFKDPKDLLQLLELTSLDLREWKEEGIIIKID
ncbi:MAG: phospholipase D-like domain-containing protein [Candidatus Caldatribacteriota bacterium]|nr:phospholipase D-like domain-containing protein [Candidatus Caldatribacteriota bacterium]